MILRFTLENVHPTDDATSITFTDELADVLPGTSNLTVGSGLPMSVCGGTLSGVTTTKLSFAGGELMSAISLQVR